MNEQQITVGGTYVSIYEENPSAKSSVTLVGNDGQQVCIQCANSGLRLIPMQNFVSGFRKWDERSTWRMDELLVVGTTAAERYLRHFAGVNERGQVLCWCHGRTSMTACTPLDIAGAEEEDVVWAWPYSRLATVEDVRELHRNLTWVLADPETSPLMPEVKA